MGSKFLVSCVAVLLSANLLAQDSCDAPAKNAAPAKAKGKPVFLQGDPLDKEYSPAYNAPAVFDVSPKMGAWSTSLYVDASFLYWFGVQEGMQIATSGVLNAGTTYLTPNVVAMNMEFEYKPGFKARFGVVGEQEWTVYGEYTWIRGENFVSQNPPATTLTAGVATTTAQTGTPVWSIDDWFLQGTAGGQALVGSNVKAKWRYAVDFADLMASRPYYQGRYLTLSPYVGLRGAWIRQMMKVSLTQATGIFGTARGIASPNIPSQPLVSKNYSNSWAVGPRVGCDGHLLLPMGFRFEGDFAASLLYTRYTSIKHREDAASGSFNPGPYEANARNLGFVRPIVEAGLGFGWGSYLYEKAYHIDFSAKYDFTLLWEQNVMRTALDYILTRTNPAPTDLMFHGLTLSGCFDF